MKNCICKIVVLKFIIGIITASYGYSQEGEWKWQHPTEVGIDLKLNDLHLFGEQSLIAVGDDGIIISTKDGGSFPESGTNRELNKVHFVDEERGWIVGDNGTVLKTTDGGKSWDEFNLDAFNNLSSVFFTSPQNGWIVGHGVVKNTTDGGQTWKSKKDVDSSQHFKSVYFKDENIGWITGNNGMIFYTQNGGENWVSQPSGTDYDMYVSFFHQALDSGWVAGDGIILRTGSQGANWHESYHDTSVHIRDMDIGVGSVSSPKYGWAVGKNGDILHTDNGGSSWSQQNSGTNRNLYGVEFFDSETGLVVGENQILFTDDGGQNWESLFNPIQDLNSVHFVNDQMGWAAGNSGTVLHTDNGGENWSEQSLDTWSNINDLHISDTLNFIWAAGSGGRVFYSLDGGNDWQEVVVDTNWSNFQSIHFADLNKGWVVNDVGDIFHTDDGGESWYYQGSTFEKLNAVYFKNEQTGYIVGNNGFILETNNGGENWYIDSASGTYENFYDIYCADNEECHIVGEYGVHIRNDGGNYWYSSYIDTSANLKSVHFIDENRGWAVSDKTNRVFYTNDGGDNWQYESALDARGLQSVFFVDEETGWTVGEGGGILHYSVLSEPEQIDLFSPGNGVTEVNLTPHFSWNVASKAEKFQIQVSKDSSFASPEIDKKTQDTFYSSSEYLLSGQTYFWRVRGENKEGYGTWSEVWQFTTEPLDLPEVELFSPSNGTEGVDLKPEFSWYSIPFVNSYRLQLSFDADFTSLEIDKEVTDTLYIPTEFLESEHDYFWRVKPQTGNEETEWSEVWHFSTENADWNREKSTSNVNLYSVYFVTEANGWAVGSGGTILHTSDGGHTWEEQQSGVDVPLYSVHFVDEETGWAVGVRGTVLRTTNGGEVWTQESSSTEMALHSVHFISSKEGWASGVNGTILYSENGGRSWEAQSTGTFTTLQSVHFTDEQSGWTAGSWGTIIETDDGGDTWTEQNSGTEVHLRDVHFVSNSPEHGWVAGEEGTLLYTADGGNTWQDIYEGGVDKDFRSLHFNDANRGYVIGRGILEDTTETVFSLHTEDGGASWTPRHSGTSNDMHFIYISPDNRGWAVGDNGTIISYTDPPEDVPSTPVLLTPEDEASGVSLEPEFSWQESSEAGEYLIELSTNEDMSTLLVTDTTRMTTYQSQLSLEEGTNYYWHVRASNEKGESSWSEVWTFSPGTGTSIASLTKGNSGEVRNYPNPFKEETRIYYELGHSSRVTLEIYSATGVLVDRLIDADRSAGRHEEVIDGSDLEPGVYIYRIETEEQNYTGKMLKK